MKMQALALLGACVVSIATAGCGDSAADNTASTAQATPVNQSRPLAGHKLVGAWQGVIEIDEQKVIESVRQNSSDLDPAEVIATLKSMAMTIDFHDDGTMALSATMTTPGGQEKNNGNGSQDVQDD